MANATLLQIEARLKACLGGQTFEERGRRSGFERRAARVIGTTDFVTSLIVARIHRRGTRYRQLEGKRLSKVIGRLPRVKRTTSTSSGTAATAPLAMPIGSC